MYTPTAVTTISKHEVKTKVVPFDDAGEIQVVPIDTVVDDGGYGLEADESRRNQAQSFCFKSRDASRSSRPWREPDIVA